MPDLTVGHGVGLAKAVRGRGCSFATVGSLAFPLRCTSRRPTAAARILVPMVEITIKRRKGGFTFLVNGRDDVVVHPDGEVTTFASEKAARETAELVVRAILRAGEADADALSSSSSSRWSRPHGSS